MIELAVFDIAGTTVEEHSAVYVALREAVEAAGGTPSSQDIEDWMGASKREAITGMLTDASGVAPESAAVEKAFDDFRSRLDAAYRAVPPTPIPGVPEVLAGLRQRGIKVVLSTGFDREVTDNLLGVLGWDSSVLDGVVCIDDVPVGRPAPYLIHQAMQRTGVQDVRSVLVAGDTARDLQAGTNAGAGIVIGVLTGGVSRESLSAQPHTHILDSLADLLDEIDLTT